METPFLYKGFAILLLHQKILPAFFLISRTILVRTNNAAKSFYALSHIYALGVQTNNLNPAC